MRIKNVVLLLFAFVFLSSFVNLGYAIGWKYVRSEFKAEPVRYVFGIFLGGNDRGYSSTMSYGEGIFSDRGGIGIFGMYNINKWMSRMWFGHKFFYIYADLEYLTEKNDYLPPEDRTSNGLLSMNQMFMVRTYIPFLKLWYGMGLNQIFGRTDFPNWGISGLVKLEFFGFFMGVYASFNPSSEYLWSEFRFGVSSLIINYLTGRRRYVK